jgi:hypothetical protein
MRVLVYEDNLMWSSRLVNTLRKLGHEPQQRKEPFPEQADVAIVNLGEERYQLEHLVPELQALGVVVIAHAGHKEKQLHELGKAIGCDILATNSELTFKIESLLEQAGALR